jgi:hypothetical protein
MGIFLKKTIQNAKPIAMSFFAKVYNNMCGLKPKENTKNFSLECRRQCFKTIIIIFKKQGVCHNVAFPFTLNKNLKAKENYENSHIRIY